MAREISFQDFGKVLNDMIPSVQEKLEQTIKLCCEKVRSEIQYDMAHTPRDTSKVYYTKNKTKGHNPSLPGNPPAPDTGNLRDCIRYEVHNENKEVYGIVGTTQKDPPYGAYLEYAEYGNSKMAPRPWLRPAMIKNEDWIKSSISKAVAAGIKGVGK